MNCGRLKALLKEFGSLPFVIGKDNTMMLEETDKMIEPRTRKAGKKKSFDLRLYLVTGESCLAPGYTLVQAVEDALQAGVTLVQYREKKAGGKEMLDTAKKLAELCHQYGASLIVNDRLDIALLSGADGVHLGQSDLPAAEARKLAGEGFIIGVTAHNVAEARDAEASGADYLGCGAVFTTHTKQDTVPLGLAGLRAIREAVHIPLVGIAGITSENYRQVLAAGADGVAVVSAIMGAEDIRGAVRSFREK